MFKNSIKLFKEILFNQRESINLVTAIQVTVWDEVRGKIQIILFLKRKVPFIQKKRDRC